MIKKILISQPRFSFMVLPSFIIRNVRFYKTIIISHILMTKKLGNVVFFSRNQMMKKVTIQFMKINMGHTSS